MAGIQKSACKDTKSKGIQSFHLLPIILTVVLTHTEKVNPPSWKPEEDREKRERAIKMLWQTLKFNANNHTVGSKLCGIQNNSSYFEAYIMSITIKERDQPLIVLKDPRGQGREDTPIDN